MVRTVCSDRGKLHVMETSKTLHFKAMQRCSARSANEPQASHRKCKEAKAVKTRSNSQAAHLSSNAKAYQGILQCKLYCLTIMNKNPLPKQNPNRHQDHQKTALGQDSELPRHGYQCSPSATICNRHAKLPASACGLRLRTLLSHAGL